MILARSGLRSHPHLLLHEHVDQVKNAVRALRKYHSRGVITLPIQEILERAVTFHDVGKATSFFQKFISDPEGYKGNIAHKSHTALSVFIVLSIAIELQWNIPDTIAVTAAISGHHSRLPTFPERRLGVVDENEYAIDRYAHGNNANILQKQLESVCFTGLITELNLDLDDFAIINKITQSIITQIRKTSSFINSKMFKWIQSLDIQEAIKFRLKCQLVYSILLEADKAFLALSDPDLFLRRTTNKWQTAWIDQRIGNPHPTNTNRLRKKMRNEVIATIKEKKDRNLFSLTAPTGTGKTLLAATWALKLRENAEDAQHLPKVVVVLPYLSVIDQTVKEYKKLLQVGKIKVPNRWLLASHSLSDRVYDSELSSNDNSFLVDTWRSDIIITTYDQFLLSLMDPRGKYQMRFHNLCDALIIMDEVQSIPCQLWQPLAEIFQQLIVIGNSKMLLMSATLPPFIENAEPLLKKPEQYFKRCKRYTIRLNLSVPVNLDEFCMALEERLDKWVYQKKRVLLTFNTRKSARKVRDYIADWFKGRDENAKLSMYFISADVTPKDRLRIIERIKEGEPCIIVSTQCIEAGVDIDVDIVIRDFAPLDSLIQIAGRCNREGNNKSRGIIEIIDIVDEGKRYSEMIYDEVHLSVTRSLLETYKEIQEENMLSLANCYFQKLSDLKDTGHEHLTRFARWQPDISVHELLRGKEKQEYSFLVLKQDPKLLEIIGEIMQVKDVWERREAWRKISGRLAMVSVSIFAKRGFHPSKIAYEFRDNTGLWILKEGYYASDRGLIIEGETMIL